LRDGWAWESWVGELRRRSGKGECSCSVTSWRRKEGERCRAKEGREAKKEELAIHLPSLPVLPSAARSLPSHSSLAFPLLPIPRTRQATEHIDSQIALLNPLLQPPNLWPILQPLLVLNPLDLLPNLLDIPTQQLRTRP